MSPLISHSVIDEVNYHSLYLFRSFRYSNSGLPMLNLDIGFSAFLAAGPALEVISKILARSRGGSGGPGGRPGSEISQPSGYEISTVKRVLRGAKVRSRSSAAGNLIIFLSSP